MSTRLTVEPASPAAVTGVVVVGAVVAAVMWAVQHASYDVWGGILVGLALLVASIPAVRWAARREADRWIGRLLAAALVLRMAGALIRYLVAFGLYDGRADATVYHDVGARLATGFRAGIFEADVGKVVGTGFLKIATGVLYTFTGPTKLGGFLVFAWLGFWGLYLWYRAFCLAVPEGDRRRYALLLFLLPSLMFWPSSISKEAWMTVALGLVAYGTARVLTRARGGFLVLALGVGAAAVVRPHVSAVVLVALLVGYVVRRSPPSASGLRPVLKVGGVAILFVAAIGVVSQAVHYFDVETTDPLPLQQVFERTELRTGQGGSAFEARPVRSPVGLVPAAITVMFRPFPYEATNGQTLIASFEGAFLLLLFVLSWRRLLAAVPLMFRRAYVAFATAYTLLFVYAFSNIANFGIVTRQRVQLLPFALVLLAVPAATTRRRAADRVPARVGAR